MLKALALLATGAALALAGVALAQQATSPVQPPPVTRTPIGKVEVPGSNYEVVFGAVELQPGFKSGRHSHPGSVMVQVLDGEFWLAIDGQPEKTYAADQSLEISNAAIHSEGAAGSKPAKILVVYVVEKGKPLVQPAQ